MLITKRSEYAILSALYLARSAKQCDIGEIAESQSLSAAFAAKTLQDLVRAGILTSRRGQRGGYSLARSADTISLLDIIEAVEGSVVISDCLRDGSSCAGSSWQLEPVWKHVQESICGKLESITLADIMGTAKESKGASDIRIVRQNSNKKITKPVILCDFDGTISKQDVSDSIFTIWLGRKWGEIDQEWHDGKISMVELYKKCWALISANEVELLEFIDSVEIDAYFREFVQRSHSCNIPVYLVSDGFDYYIERIMGSYDISDLKYYSNHLSFAGGRLVLGFNNQHPECTQCANCKKFVMDEKRKAADYVIYIGNGLSDRCAAEHADLVFAKDSLLKHCLDKGIPCISYENFGQIIEYLDKNSIFEG